MRTNFYLSKLTKLLPDTPDNEQIFFAAHRKQGRFWLDDPETPAALVACTGGKAPLSFLKTLDVNTNIDWGSLLLDAKPEGTLIGERDLIIALAKQFGYSSPFEEIVFAQRGFLRLKEKLAEMVVRYSDEAFELVCKNSPWLWESYSRVQAALEEIPAFAIFDQKQIVALAMVGSHSFKWANIGYWVHNDFRHKEYATRCAASLTAYLNQHGYSATATTDESHLPSLAVMNKIGLIEYSRHFRAPKLPRKHKANTP